MKRIVSILVLTLIIALSLPCTPVRAAENAVYTDSYYAELSDKEKKLYDGMRDNISLMKDGVSTVKFEVDGIYEHEMKGLIGAAVSAFRLDLVWYYYVDWSSVGFGYAYNESTGEVTRVEIYLREDKENYYYGEYSGKKELEDELLRLEAAVFELVSAARRFDTDIERILYVHDEIINNCEYNTSDDLPKSAWTPVSALLYGYGEKGPVCEGYAKAFKLCMDALGIECALIPGMGITSSDTEGHLWNAVKLDGEWYGIDLTWDDTKSGGIKHEYFLVGSETENSRGVSFSESHVPGTKEYMKREFAVPQLSKKAHPDAFVPETETETETETDTEQSASAENEVTEDETKPTSGGESERYPPYALILLILLLIALVSLLIYAISALIKTLMQ